MSTVFFSSHGISYFCVKRIIMIEYGGMNSGTRAFTFAMMGNELVSVIYDSRWNNDGRSYAIDRFSTVNSWL